VQLAQKASSAVVLAAITPQILALCSASSKPRRFAPTALRRGCGLDDASAQLAFAVT
jgi:hypothetical protein